MLIIRSIWREVANKICGDGGSSGGSDSWWPAECSFLALIGRDAKPAMGK